MINDSLERDFYKIIKEGKLLQCQEVGDKFIIRREIDERTQIDYYYPTRKTRDEDHYELAQMYFYKQIS